MSFAQLETGDSKVEYSSLQDSFKPGDFFEQAGCILLCTGENSVELTKQQAFQMYNSEYLRFSIYDRICERYTCLENNSLSLIDWKNQSKHNKSQQTNLECTAPSWAKLHTILVNLDALNSKNLFDYKKTSPLGKSISSIRAQLSIKKYVPEEFVGTFDNLFSAQELAVVSLMKSIDDSLHLRDRSSTNLSILLSRSFTLPIFDEILKDKTDSKSQYLFKLLNNSERERGKTFFNMISPIQSSLLGNSDSNRYVSSGLAEELISLLREYMSTTYTDNPDIADTFRKITITPTVARELALI